MWLNFMNIKDCNTWQVSVTRDGYRVRWLFPRSHGIEKFVIWFTENRYPLLCFCNTINLLGDMAMLDSCSCYPPSNHLHAMHILFWKNRYKSHFLSIHSPAYKTSSCMIDSNSLVTWHSKNGNRASFCKKMDWESSSFYVCVSEYRYNEVVQCNYILKSCSMWMHWQKFLQWFYSDDAVPWKAA